MRRILLYFKPKYRKLSNPDSGGLSLFDKSFLNYFCSLIFCNTCFSMLSVSLGVVVYSHAPFAFVL